MVAPTDPRRALSMESTSTDPDGRRKRCDVCGHLVRVHPSVAGDSTCPRCGSLLWHPHSKEGLIRSVQRDVSELGGVAVFDDDSEAWKLDLRGLRLDGPAVRRLRSLERVE